MAINDQVFQAFMEHGRVIGTQKIREMLAADYDVDVVLLVRGVARGEAQDWWSIQRTFESNSDLEEYLESARVTVATWDHNPSHIRHAPVEIGTDE